MSDKLSDLGLVKLFLALWTSECFLGSCIITGAFCVGASTTGPFQFEWHSFFLSLFSHSKIYKLLISDDSSNTFLSPSLCVGGVKPPDYRSRR